MTASENAIDPENEEALVDGGLPDDGAHELDIQVDEDVEVEAEEPTAPAAPARASRSRRTLIAATLGLLLGSAVAAASVYWFLFRPDQLTDETAQKRVIAAAKEGIEAALSYSPESLEDDLATAKSHMTGKFLDYYSDFTKNVVTPAAKDKGVKTEANVSRAAVSEMRPDKADVLVFINQVTTSTSRPTPALATSTVVVTMVRSGDRWLISEFNPV